MEYLGIRLGVNPDSVINWILWSDQENEIIASGSLNSSQDLVSVKEKSPDAKVIGIAPSSVLGLKEVNLPAKTNKKVLQALPYMLEEDIAQDISDCFFAFGKRAKNSQQVVFCEKRVIEQWQSQLRDAELFCDTIVPDVLCLPFTNDNISIMQLGTDLIARTAEFEGYQAESSWLSALVIQESQNSKQAITAYSELTDIDANQILELTSDFELLPMLTLLNGARSTQFNLLQGQFSAKRKSNNNWKKWRIAASLAVIALGVNMIDMSIKTNQLKAQREQIRVDIEQATKRGFPNLGRVLNHRRILARELEKLEQSGSGVNMLAMLANLAPVFSSTSVKPQLIRFDASRSEIRVLNVATNFESLEQFRKGVVQLGYDVEQGAINNQGTQVSGGVTIKG